MFHQDVAGFLYNNVGDYELAADCNLDKARKELDRVFRSLASLSETELVDISGMNFSSLTFSENR